MLQTDDLYVLEKGGAEPPALAKDNTGMGVCSELDEGPSPAWGLFPMY